MRELNLQEVQAVSGGGDTLDGAALAVGALTGFALMVGAPAAAAFGFGVAIALGGGMMYQTYLR